MRSARVWLVTVLLLSRGLAAQAADAPAQKAAPTIPTFKQAKSWQLSYTCVAGSSDDDATALTVSFLAPNHLLAKSSGEPSFTAVSDGQSIRVVFPDLGVAMWTPAAYSFELPQIGSLTVGGARGPLNTDWKATRAALQGTGKADEEEKRELLPEEEIAGRKCLVLRTTVQSSLPEGPENWVTTEWFDAEYGLPLGIRTGAGEQSVEARATSVAIDPALDAGLFTVEIPEGTPLFRGPLDCCTMNEISAARSGDLAETALSRLPPDELTKATSVLQPAWAPADFRSTGSAGTSFSEDTKGYSAAWAHSLVWFSRSGGVIAFDQGVGDVKERQSRLPGGKKAVTVRGKAGRLLAYHEPFDGLALTWEDGAQWFKLEGTGVTADDLVKMAEGMKEVKVAPAPKGEEEAQPSQRSTPGAQ